MSSQASQSSFFSSMDGLLKPKSIAVVGATDTPGKVGYTVLRNIVSSGYQGAVYPINPKDPVIQGMKAYPSVLDVPGEIDAAVIVVPAKLCAQVTEECGRKGVKGLIIITSGFSEVGHRELEEELVRIAGRYGTRILGPNIVGVLSNSDKMNASFAPFLPYPGKSSMVSQSGALVVAIDAATYVRNVGFDKLISIGNMADVDIADCIEWLDRDPNTTCIALYIEGLKNGRRFIEAGLEGLQADRRPQGGRLGPRRGRGGLPYGLPGRGRGRLRIRVRTGLHRPGERPQQPFRPQSRPLAPAADEGREPPDPVERRRGGRPGHGFGRAFRHPVEVRPSRPPGSLEKAHAGIRLGPEPGRPDRHGAQRVVLRHGQDLPDASVGERAGHPLLRDVPDDTGRDRRVPSSGESSIPV